MRMVAATRPFTLHNNAGLNWVQLFFFFFGSSIVWWWKVYVACCVSTWNVWYCWDDHICIYSKIFNARCVHCFPRLLMYQYCFWNLFASIFSTSVGTNYLDHSIGVLSHNPFVSLFIRKDFGSKLFKPLFGREFFMCTGTSYDNYILSYIYTECQ